MVEREEQAENSGYQKGQQIGQYQVVGQLDQGRFAGTFLGQHIHHKKQYVLDMHTQPLADELKEAFLQQARHLEKLTHPHILQIRDAGLENRMPFLVVEYVPHITLRQVYPKEKVQPLAKFLTYLKQIGEALQYAHEKGYLHRQLRPENLLLNRNNQVLVYDFALDALIKNRKRVGQQNAQQALDAIPYTAPEQIQGKPCAASDQYSLAVIIYEWLAGNSPFQGSYVEIANQHVHTQPPALRLKVPGIASQAEKVIMRALAKEPARRHSSLQAFVKALEEAYTQSQVTAKKISSSEAKARPVPLQQIAETPTLTLVEPVSTSSSPQTHTSATTSSAVSSVAQLSPVPPLPATPPPAASQTHSIHGALPLTPTELAPIDPPVEYSPARRDKPEPLTRRALMTGLLGLAAAGGAIGTWYLITRKSGNVSHSINTTNTTSRATQPQITSDGTLIYRAHPARVNSTAWSPDGKLIASASDDQLIQVFDAGTGAVKRTYTGHTGAVTNVVWSPDGTRLASASEDHTVQVWDTGNGENLSTYQGHSGIVNALSWSSDGQLIASASEDKSVQVWNSASGGLFLNYQQHSAGVLSVAWSPDGHSIASGSWDDTLQDWATVPSDAFAIGQTIFKYGGHTAEIYAVAWSPDGQLIASGGGDRTVLIGRGVDGVTKVKYSGHNDAVHGISWSPDGKLIASCSEDGTVQVWNASSKQVLYTYRGHSRGVYSVAWSPDGRRIASSGADNTVQVWKPKR
ncbi:serine/threonine-protein kinase [Ktedonobacter robiniae]|uniref:Protein kinase domain-containing protein n=1 Tax=Ktedonobacter robiniae TaxID=2778365 RepID=A0ABQ3UTJ8_9CHLR|nr:serine/threonine-protein kinase [Ktedonobacter robiniae]GHO55720.1 hypothetical protein KSB_41950 [Ktedonobacter robiniae]